MNLSITRRHKDERWRKDRRYIKAVACGGACRRGGCSFLVHVPHYVTGTAVSKGMTEEC